MEECENYLVSDMFGIEFPPPSCQATAHLFLPSAELSATATETSRRQAGVTNFHFAQTGLPAVLTLQN